MAVNHLVTGSNPVGGAIFFKKKSLTLFCCGEMAEWSKATVLKTVESVRAPRVRIPVSPPFFLKKKIGRVPEWLNGLPC